MLTLFFGWLSAVHVAAADVRANVLFLVVDDLAPAFEAYNYPVRTIWLQLRRLLSNNP